MLHALELPDRDAELTACLRVLDGELVRGLRSSDRFRRHGDCTGIEQAGERELSAWRRDEHRFARDAHAREPQCAHTFGRIDQRVTLYAHSGLTALDQV